jgi:hypothetical protein
MFIHDKQGGDSGACPSCRKRNIDPFNNLKKKKKKGMRNKRRIRGIEEKGEEKKDTLHGGYSCRINRYRTDHI